VIDDDDDPGIVRAWVAARAARIEAAARELVAGWEPRRLTNPRQVHAQREQLVQQLRSALEGRASSSPSPGGAAPPRR
jgi:hypothetical protein